MHDLATKPPRHKDATFMYHILNTKYEQRIITAEIAETAEKSEVISNIEHPESITRHATYDIRDTRYEIRIITAEFAAAAEKSTIVNHKS